LDFDIVPDFDIRISHLFVYATAIKSFVKKAGNQLLID